MTDPHLMAIWPRSREAVVRNFQDRSEAVKWNIVHENAAKLYHIDLN